MENTGPNPGADREKGAAELEAEAEAALKKRERERITMNAREFVSERDALEDAWKGSGEHSTRDEGW